MAEKLESEPGPEEHPQSQRPICPEENASWISRLFFWWVLPFVYSGWKHPLQEAQLWELRDFERGQQTTATLMHSWKSVNAERTTNDRLLKSIFRSFWSVFLFSAFFKLIDVITFVIQPIVLNRLIRFLQSDKDTPIGIGIAWSFALLLVPIIRSLCESQYFSSAMRGGLRVRSSLQGLLYDKSLRMSPSARASCSLGEIVNLMQLDSHVLATFFDFFSWFGLLP